MAKSRPEDTTAISAETIYGGTHTIDSREVTERLKNVLFDGIDALPCGFALFDAQDRAILTNKTFREMLPEGADLLDSGATFPEMARLNAVTQFGIENSQIEDWMERRLAYRESPKDFFDQQLMDGRWFRIQESRTSEGGTVTNWTDITDLKIQEQVAENYADALISTNQQLEEFAHVASHDLQEPLRKIEVFGGRLSDKCGAELGESGARYLERIIDATGRMRRLINDLLDFSRIDNQKDSFAPTDMNLVLKDVLANLDLRIQDHGATVTVGELPTIQGDFGQLSRLFQNLISNAIKYVQPGVKPIIDVAVITHDETQLKIAVRDNGIGFEQKNADKIFEVFQRLHGRSSSYEGTGIGLASCRKIVDQHNGNIKAESAPGMGSTFFVTLPVGTA